MNPQVRTGVTHAGTAVGGAIAMLAFMAQHKVDLYAVMDQLNVVIADFTKLLALLTPIATGAYGIWKSTTKQRLNDLAQNPDIKGIVTTPEIAVSVPSPKVVSTAAAMPDLAQASVGGTVAQQKIEDAKPKEGIDG